MSHFERALESAAAGKPNVYETRLPCRCGYCGDMVACVILVSAEEVKTEVDHPEPVCASWAIAALSENQQRPYIARLRKLEAA